MAKKPAPFQRPSINLDKTRASARQWKEAHACLLAEGDLVALSGRVNKIETAGGITYMELGIDNVPWRGDAMTKLKAFTEAEPA